MEAPPERSYPKILTIFTSTGFQVVFTLLALGLTLFYNLAYYAYVPLTGVWLDYADQQRDSAVVFSLDRGGPGERAGLQVGDRILTIDGRAITNLNVPVHQPKKPGEVELYVIERRSQILTIPVVVGNYLEQPGSLADILPVQLLSLVVCLFGLILLFFSAPSDVRARLISIGWVLAGVVLAATGPGYSGCIWLAPQVAMLTFAVATFVTLSAHLYFPLASFSDRTRNWMIWMLFYLSMVLMLGYLSQQIWFAFHHQNPASSLTEQAITSIFYASLLASIGLLLKNRFFVKDRDIKRQTSLIFLGTLVGFMPFLLFSALPTLLFGRGSANIILPSTVSILSLIFLPISYGYVVYQRRLLKIDFFINRALVLFLLVLITLFVSFMVLSGIAALMHLPTRMAIAGSLLCVLIALPSASLRKRIQVQVDHALYGGYYDYTTVTSDLSKRLAQTIDRSAFITLLTCELPEKMKITRAELMLLSDDHLKIQGSTLENISLRLEDEICEILRVGQEPLLAQGVWDLTHPELVEYWRPFFWVRLFLPIVYGEILYGLLLLGERASGDIYSNQDLQILNTVGQQAALTIANIVLVETLRGLAQQLVRADEEQRKKVARDLHDSVLQDLFFVKQRLARSDPEAASFIDHSIHMLRQTIKAQRTSLLDRGLSLALQDLVAVMGQLANGTLSIVWRSHLDGEIVLSDEKATSLYRIVQESLSNVLKHSQAEMAVVSARKIGSYLEIQVEDDGIGIQAWDQAGIGQHYGLLGMKERAAMIGAEMNVTSLPGAGTKVLVRLKL
jgi:two-component system sensor histidine kinase ComP